jgi:hypothetical protein
MESGENGVYTSYKLVSHKLGVLINYAASSAFTNKVGGLPSRRQICLANNIQVKDREKRR